MANFSNCNPTLNNTQQMSISSSSTWTFAQTFCASFQSSTSDLEQRIESAIQKLSRPHPQTEAPHYACELQALSSELVKLTKSLAEATGSLPSYDQRQCELQLKTLEKTLEGLRTSTAPKSKFAFKRKANPNLKPPSPPSSSASFVPPLAAIQNSATDSTNITLASQSEQYLTLQSLPKFSGPPFSDHSHSDLTITDLDKCIVDFLPSSTRQHEGREMDISALHIRNVMDTILLLPIIQGSVILHNLKRCVVVVGCHQFRMHTSENVDVYLWIPSHPIIEHSSGIRFAAYPTSLYPPAQPISDKYTSVQDFSHIRPSQSPNWCIMPDGTRRDDWLQLGLAEDEAIGKLLDGLLPSPSLL